MRVRELRNFHHLIYEKGDTIFNAGESGRFAYIINSGTIKLFRSENGREEVLGYMQPGQVLGEMAIINGEPRTASAEAAEHTEVLVIDDGVLRNVMNRCLPLVKALMEQFIKRIRDTEQEIKTGHFAVNVEKYNEMEDALRLIFNSTEEKLSGSQELQQDVKELLLKINQSCRTLLQPS